MKYLLKANHGYHNSFDTLEWTVDEFYSIELSKPGVSLLFFTMFPV